MAPKQKLKKTVRKRRERKLVERGAAHIRSVARVEDRPFSPLGEPTEVLDGVKSAPFPVLEPRAGEAMRLPFSAVGRVVEPFSLLA